MQATEKTTHPEVPTVILKDFKALFSKPNRKIGWSIWGQMFVLGFVTNGLFKAMESAKVSDTAQGILGLATFPAWAFFIVYIGKSVAKKKYGIELKGGLWPYFWRIIASIVICLGIIFVPGMIGFAISDSVGGIIMGLSILPVIYCQPSFFGWALHQQIRIVQMPKLQNATTNADSGHSPDSAEEKLSRLKKMLDGGLIGQDDYNSQKSALLAAFSKDVK